jgi:hypothetical protein
MDTTLFTRFSCTNQLDNPKQEYFLTDWYDKWAQILFFITQSVCRCLHTIKKNNDLIQFLKKPNDMGKRMTYWRTKIITKAITRFLRDLNFFNTSRQSMHRVQVKALSVETLKDENVYSYLVNS